MSEKIFQTCVKRELVKAGCFCLVSNDVSRGGIPDLIIVHDGRAIWLELKFHHANRKGLEEVRLDHPVSALQSKFLRDLGEAGAISGVLIGFGDDCVEFIDHSRLHPGKENRFDLKKPLALEDFIEWICGSAVAIAC
jgi:hypothetical protein